MVVLFDDSVEVSNFVLQEFVLESEDGQMVEFPLIVIIVRE